MNVEIWTEAAQFPEKEYINGIFLAVFSPKTAKRQSFDIFNNFCNSVGFR